MQLSFSAKSKRLLVTLPRDLKNTVELHLSGLIGTEFRPDMQKIQPTLVFSLKIGYTGSLKFGCYYLQYVPVSKPLDRGLI